MTNMIITILAGLLMILYGLYIIIFHKSIWRRCIENKKHSSITNPVIDIFLRPSKLSYILNRFLIAPLFLIIGVTLVYIISY